MLFFDYTGSMKLACLIIAAPCLLTGSSQSFAADAGSCYAISSMDARTYCLAKARHDPGMCYAIQSADMRAQCLAEVRK